jgi:hypothetical protein
VLPAARWPVSYPRFFDRSTHFGSVYNCHSPKGSLCGHVIQKISRRHPNGRPNGNARGHSEESSWVHPRERPWRHRGLHQRGAPIECPFLYSVCKEQAKRDTIPLKPGLQTSLSFQRLLIDLPIDVQVQSLLATRRPGGELYRTNLGFKVATSRRRPGGKLCHANLVCN